MAALTSLLLRPCKEILGRPIQIQRNTTLKLNGLYNSTSFRCLATARVQQGDRNDRNKDAREFQIQDILRRIDRNQPIHSFYFKKLFSTIQKEKKMDQQEASLLLHMCCSGMTDFSHSRRAERADDVWASIKDLGVEPTIRLYNLRLKALRDNKRQINPMQELMDIKAEGCTPDAVTFTLLIGCFCNNGDIQGADLILETMQEAGLGLSINIFNSYIAGYLKNDSVQKALDTLDIIKSRDLNANQDTYLRFALYYAQKGDSEQVNKYVDVADGIGSSLRDFQFIDLYKAFMLGGHADKAREFLEPLSEGGLLEINSVDLSCNMIAEGMVQEGKEFFMSETTRTHDLRMIVLKSMIDNGISPNEVMKSALEISSEGQLPIDDTIIMYGYKEGLADWAVKYLDLMKTKKMPLRPTHYLPALCFYRDKKDVKSLCKLTLKLLQCELSKDNVDFIIDTLIAVVYQPLTELGFTREDIVNKMPGAELDWNSIFFVVDLKKSLLTASENIGHKKMNPKLLNCNQMFFSINGKLITNWQEKLEMTKGMNRVLKEFMIEKIIIGLLSRNDTKDLLVPALDFLKANEMKIRPRISGFISLEMQTEEVLEKIQEVTYSPERYEDKRHWPIKSNDELKAMTTEEVYLLAKQHLYTNRYQFELIDRAVADRDGQKVQEIVSHLIKREFKWEKRHFKLVQFLMNNGCLEEAVAIFNVLKNNLNETITPNVPMRLALAQLESGNFEECLETVKATCELSRDLTKEEMSMFNKNAGNIFETVTTSEQADAVMAAISLKNLMSDNHAPSITDRYVRSVINKVTEDRLMEIVSDCVSKYKHFPYLTSVLTRLVKSQNVAQLKVAMTLGTKTMGIPRFHSRLATAFLNAGMPGKAAVVMKTSTDKYGIIEFQKKSEYFIRSKNIKGLESLFEISKDFDVSQAIMLDCLVQGYVSIDDTDTALTRLEASVEGHVIPLRSTVDLLIMALTKKNMEIPEILRNAKNSYGESSV